MFGASSPREGSIAIDKQSTTPSEQAIKSKTVIIRRLCSVLFDQLYELATVESEEVINKLGVDLLAKVQDAATKSKQEQNKSNQYSSKKEGRLTIGKRQSPMLSIKSKSNKVRPVSSIGGVSSAVDRRLAIVLEKNESIEDRRFTQSSPHAGVSGGPVRKSFFRLFFTLPNDDGMYDIFLNYRIPEFQSDQRRLDFLSFKRSDSNLPFIVLFCALCAVFVATRFHWSAVFTNYQLYPTALVSIVCAVLSATCLLWCAFNRVALLSFQYQIVPMQRFHPAVVHLQLSLRPGG
jgi:hypothetical protein